MSRRSTRSKSAIERLESKQKQNDVVNDDEEIKIESHPPPSLNKRVRVDAEERHERKVLKSTEKEVQEAMERHADLVTKHQLNKVDKQLDVVDASRKSLNKEDNNENDDNNDEDDDADDDNNDDNNDDDTRTLADVVKWNTHLTARGVKYKKGTYQSILCSVRVKYFIFVTC